jgi:malonyl-CoA/methylmalonyl-CoA synthetase
VPATSVPTMSEPLFPRLAAPDGGEAIRVGAASLSYRQLAGAAASVAERLRGAGRVAVWAQPTLEVCVGVVGALAAGATIVPINPGSGRRELEHILADSDSACVLTGDGVEIPAPLAETERIDVDLAADGGSLPDELGDGAVAFVLYTSGTTGFPKGVQISRGAITSNLDALAEIWAWTDADRLAHALPVFHVHGLVIGILGPLRRGGQIEHVGRFSPQAIAGALTRGATMVFGVPTMYHRIVAEAAKDPDQAAVFGRARLLVSGSAPLPAADHERMRELTGQAIRERYGMTETLISAGVRVDEDVTPGRVGPPVPGVEVKLLDDHGTTIETSDDQQIGEIAVRGPNLFSGYLNQPDATANAFRDGWFLTGDLATRAPSGSLRIVGRRATDLIKSGGYRIGAGEIEGALLEHPAVSEAAVTGRPDPDLGERVAAWVVLEPGEHVGTDELAAYVASLLTKHKRPREVHVVDALPRNEMGKVMKRALAVPEP